MPGPGLPRNGVVEVCSNVTISIKTGSGGVATQTVTSTAAKVIKKDDLQPQNSLGERSLRRRGHYDSKEGGLKTWHIILIVAVSVAILGGAGAFFYFRHWN